MSPLDPYPLWKYYPSRDPAPEWVPPLVETFENQRATIESVTHSGVSSDAVLAALCPELQALGYEVETGKTKFDKVVRPVLFGEQGTPLVSYEVDGYHDHHQIVLEVEAGRGAANNAAYRDIIRASLVVDAEFLVLAMMQRYTSGGNVWRSYESTRDQFDAIYASERLKLPFSGVLLVGY